MFSNFKLFLLPIIVFTTFPSLYSSLNITEMIVPSIVSAPEKVLLNCMKEVDKENDKFKSLEWSKLISGKWKVFKKIPISAEGNETITTPSAINLHKLEDLVEPFTEDGNVEFSKSSLSTEGLYKCSIRSTLELFEKVMELRVIYKPEEVNPAIYHSVKNDYIKVICSAPASHPRPALKFFVNYELPAEEEFRYLTPIDVKNTTYGETVVLSMNVAELKIRPNHKYVLNGNLHIVCTATLANIYHKSAELNIPYDGPIYEDKCLSGVMIALIVVLVSVSVIIIAGIVFFVIRKKKINSINKVAELFNKQKTVLNVDKE